MKKLRRRDCCRPERSRVAGGRRADRFDRADGYLGVKIDDLVTRASPSRRHVYIAAEYRLTLRADNADQRLTHKALPWAA